MIYYLIGTILAVVSLAFNSIAALIAGLIIVFIGMIRE